VLKQRNPAQVVNSFIADEIHNSKHVKLRGWVNNNYKHCGCICVSVGSTVVFACIARRGFLLIKTVQVWSKVKLLTPAGSEPDRQTNTHLACSGKIAFLQPSDFLKRTIKTLVNIEFRDTGNNTWQTWVVHLVLALDLSPQKDVITLRVPATLPLELYRETKTTKRVKHMTAPHIYTIHRIQRVSQKSLYHMKLTFEENTSLCTVHPISCINWKWGAKDNL
jgi:hypothetical protein